MPAAPAVTTPIAAPPSPEEVESLLTELISAYGELTGLATEHRAAISRADGGAVESCARREAALASRLAALDERRRSILPASGGERVTISTLVERLPEPARGRAAELTGQLRELVRTARHEYATIRAATQSLVGHIDGLVQQVAHRLHGPGVYGPEGRVASGARACGIDTSV
jgi:hypothetical protein